VSRRAAARALGLLALALAAGAQSAQAAPPIANLHEIKWFVHTDLVSGSTPVSFYQSLLEDALADARLLLEGHQGPADGVCCQKLALEDHGGGSLLATFGTPGDGLDSIGPGELAVLNGLGGSGTRGFLVDEITDCGGNPAIGCATLPACSSVQPPDDDPNLILIVTLDAESLGVTGLAIAHERGHNACLLHPAEPAESCQLMRAQAGGGCLDAAQCTLYQAARQSTGGVCACHDGAAAAADGAACVDDSASGLCSGGVCGAAGSDASVWLMSAGGPEAHHGGVPNDPLRLSGLPGGWADNGWLAAAKGLEFDPDRQVLYAIEDAPGDDLLVILHPTLGTKLVTIGPIAGHADVIALAFDPGDTPAPDDDRLLALSSSGGFEDLIAIDPTSAAPTFLGSLLLGVFNGFQGLAYDDVNDRLYASGFLEHGLVEIDTSTCPFFCGVSEVESVFLPRESSGLAFSRATGRLYQVGAQSLGRTLYASVDTGSLTATPSIGLDAFTVGGLAAVPVPEPGGLGPLAAGGALLAGLAHRRRRPAGGGPR
jgi:hypothetical protein